MGKKEPGTSDFNAIKRSILPTYARSDTESLKLYERLRASTRTNIAGAKADDSPLGNSAPDTTMDTAGYS